MIARDVMIERTVRAFWNAHRREPAVVAFAPGRVNLIGEHTDYNDGFALPCALECGTVVALAARDDRRIVAQAIDLGSEAAEFLIDGEIPMLATGHWQNHLRGIVAGLPRFGLPVTGANLVISGNIPKGAGLSSSASLGIALGLGMATLAGASKIDRLVLAQAAQWSEHHFVGCNCGVMDQVASALGQRESALLIDCRSLATEPVAFPAQAAIMIVQSGVVRGMVDSAYNERRAQCAAAADYYGVAALRDLDVDALATGHCGLAEAALRRARHVVTENARTIEAAQAMMRGDLGALGDAMRASHASLRDDFEVSVPAVDALVDCLNTAIGRHGGARMTGGGFGGCVVAVLPNEMVATVQRRLAGFWQDSTIPDQLVLVTRPSVGAVLLPAR